MLDFCADIIRDGLDVWVYSGSKKTPNDCLNTRYPAGEFKMVMVEGVAAVSTMVRSRISQSILH